MSAPDAGSELVFVYGTLRRGASNACRMEGARFVETGKLRGRLYRIDWYPGLVLDAEAGWVMGDLFRVSPEHLRQLDGYEGLAEGEIQGSEYRRVVAGVHSADFPGFPRGAWVWEWIGPIDRERMIVSGDWMDVEQPRRAPWFTAISGICLLAFPAGIVMGAAVSYSGSALEEIAEVMFLIGALLSPFLAFWAGYLANRRREGMEGVRMAIFIFAMVAGTLAVIVALMWLVWVLERF